jgi:hypothetical protein
VAFLPIIPGWRNYRRLAFLGVGASRATCCKTVIASSYTVVCASIQKSPAAGVHCTGSPKPGSRPGKRDKPDHG